VFTNDDQNNTCGEEIMSEASQQRHAYQRCYVCQLFQNAFEELQLKLSVLKQALVAGQMSSSEPAAVIIVATTRKL
jgi:hypothetical protein